KLSNVSSYDRLHMSLFMNYDVNERPLFQGVPTNVTLGLSVNFMDIDEMSGKITLHCWLSTVWRDELRSWNPKEFENITKLAMPSHKVWKPQITLFNAADDDGAYLAETTKVIIKSSGTILWVPPAVYTAYCKLNMRNWPYDEQTCKLKIGTWAQDRINAYYDIPKQALCFEELAQSTEWEMVGVKTTNVTEDHYNYIEFLFTARRRSSMYTAVIYTPASCIVVLALSTFWLPPQMGEKILLNGTLIILTSVFLMYFASLLPVLADNTPMIVLFYSSSLMLLCISTIIEVVVLYLSTAQHKRRVPDFLKRLLHGRLGSFLLLSNFTNEQESRLAQGNGIAKELEENVYDNADEITNPLDINPILEPSARALQFDWVLLATAVDRVCFIGFSLVYTILAIVYAV
ncbi:hypothetical protein KR222_007698, partial [Zaprionus bogoriensis]